MARDEILRQGAATAKEIAALRAVMHMVKGLEEQLANPAWIANIFTGGNTIISPAHDVFEDTTQVPLH
eukprot:2655821-Rhodomonas_salina.1